MWPKLGTTYYVGSCEDKEIEVHLMIQNAVRVILMTNKSYINYQNYLVSLTIARYGR